MTREKPDIRYDILEHFSKRIRNHLLTLMGDINMVGHVIKSYKAKLFYWNTDLKNRKLNRQVENNAIKNEELALRFLP